MADPLNILQSVVSTAQFLLEWMETRKSQESVIADLRACLLNIHTSILLPLSTSEPPDQRVMPPLVLLHDNLMQTHQHLKVWEESRKKTLGKLWAFVNPWALLDKLKADKKQMMFSLQILSAAMLVIQSVPQPQSPKRALKAMPSMTLVSSNTEVKAFWNERIGEKASSCSADQAISALVEHLDRMFKKNAAQTLLLRLDEYNLGCVSLAAFDRFVGAGSILEALTELDVFENLSMAANDTLLGEEKEEKDIQPILILVDDEPYNHSFGINLAERLGIAVYTFTSSAAAKSWIEGNEDMLRKADKYSKLRIITDNARWEVLPPNTYNPPSSNSFSSSARPNQILDLRAGEAILRYIRGRKYAAPVLVCASLSIGYTRFVLDYELAGSTTRLSVRNDFIRTLTEESERRAEPDDWWVGFDVPTKSEAKPMLVLIGEKEKVSVVERIAKDIHQRMEILHFFVNVPEKDGAGLAYVKEWVQTNKVLLRRMTRANLVRFISVSSSRDGSLGQEFVEFMKNEEVSQAPILLLSNTSSTPFIDGFLSVESIADPEVIKDYIWALVERERDDEELPMRSWTWSKEGSTNWTVETKY